MIKTKLKTRKYGKYQFCDKEDLVALWCKFYYPEQVVLVIFNSYEAFDLSPVLAILKRDNFKVYTMGMLSEFAIIEFDLPEKAVDFSFNFEYKTKIRWSIYNKGFLHAKSK